MLFGINDTERFDRDIVTISSRFIVYVTFIVMYFELWSTVLENAIIVNDCDIHGSLDRGSWCSKWAVRLERYDTT